MFYVGNVLNIDFVYIILSVIATLMAIFVAMPFHEFAHAWAAKSQGDYTAVSMKRYTLAFHKHFDAIGFIFLFLFGFGWAKPVPIDPRNFKHGNKSLFLVSIAGILMNFVLGVLFLFIYLFLYKFFPQIYDVYLYGFLLKEFLEVSISFNFVLVFFNILPLYPLDGYNVISSLCKTENTFLRVMKKYSVIFYLIIVFTGLFSLYYTYVARAVIGGLTKLFSIILRL